MGSVVLRHPSGGPPRPPLDPAARPSWPPRRPAAVEPPARSAVEALGLIGSSAVMQTLFAALERFAPHARATLITGETGTGKAAMARALHALGPRRGGAFVPVHCASFAGRAVDLRSGPIAAAWVAAADQTRADVLDGPVTLFFDEIADLPMALQAALVHTLEALDPPTPGADDRMQILAATSRDLHGEMAAGHFRSDLYYRLAVFELHAPPLRERLEDLPDLSEVFLAQIGTRVGRPSEGLTGGAKRLLQSLPWAGNLRELRNLLERARLMTDGGPVGEGAVRAALASAGASAPVPTPPGEPSARLDDAQRAHVRAVLERAHGNKSLAATRLGISRRALYRLIEKLDA